MAALHVVSPRAPKLLGVVGLITAAYILVPIVALAFRVPWGELGAIATSAQTLQMLRITLAAAFIAMVIATALGTGLALWLQYLRRSAQIVRLLVYLPLALPPVVAGLALTAAVGRRGLFAPLLEATGIQFAFAFSGVVVAHIFVALPFVVVAVDSALTQIDREVILSARGVGLKAARIYGSIILPLISPAVLTGAALAFARSLGEFGTTITFAGSTPGATRTLPLGIYLERETSAENAYALSAILIVLAVLSLAAAGIPSLLRREHESVARRLAPMDIARLRALTRPASGGTPVRVSTRGASTLFPADQVTALVGVNGAGKTTLLSLIAGRLRAEGTSVDTAGARAVLLTQRPGLPPTTTARGAITMVTEDAARTDELIAAAGLGELAQVRVPDLSGGQAAQVALLRALATRPAVLLLDEPMSALDLASAARWRSLLKAGARDRTTIVISHNALDVVGLSDAIVALEGGAVVASGATGDVLRHPPSDLLAQMGGLNRLPGAVVRAGASELIVRCGEQDLALDAALAPGAAVGDRVAVLFPPGSTHLGSGTAGNLTLIGTIVASAATTVAAAQLSVEVGGSAVISVPVDTQRALQAQPGAAQKCWVDAGALRVDEVR